MNILDKLIGANHPNDDADLSPEQEADDRKRRRTLAVAREENLAGLRGRKFLSTGQQRRAALRAQSTEQRKNRTRFKRSWLRNQQAIAVLRGQMQVIDGGEFIYDDLYRNVERHLVRAYGSVDAAREHWAKISADQAAQAKRRQGEVLRAMVEADDRVKAGGQFGVDA